MERTPPPFRPERAAGLAFVVALHAAALWGLWQHRLLPDAQEAVTLFVNFITPPPPKKREEPKPPPPPKPRPIEKPQPRQIVAETPVIAPADPVAPPPPPRPAPAIEAPPAPPPRPAEPVMLGSELSVACPERTPPRYPHHSRRMGEEGSVVLRVELDEHGNVSTARVATSSGFTRLDEAALAAVRGWRCVPPTHHGRPARAVAVQPFNFVLQGS
jgi:protein TonB